MRRRLALGLGAVVVAVALVGASVRPSLLAQIRLNDLSTRGEVAVLWSVERYADVVEMESAGGVDGPLEIRLVSPEGSVVVQRQTRRVDPSVNEGVCAGERLAPGVTWWSSLIPAQVAADLRTRGETAYRFEGRSESEVNAWKPIVLVDSGCRGVGRG